MPSSDQRILQLSSLLTQTGAAFSAPGSPTNRLATSSAQSAQSGIIAEQRRQLKKKAEKEQKGKLGGSIGATLGGLAGVALAPFTGGASLALTAALGAGGAALGDIAGTTIAGGEVDPGSVLQSAVIGGIGGGISGGLANAGAGVAGAGAKFTQAVAPSGGVGLQTASRIGLKTALQGASGAGFLSGATGGFGGFGQGVGQPNTFGGNAFGGMLGAFSDRPFGMRGVNQQTGRMQFTQTNFNFGG